MNNHFEDAWYYAKRASNHLARGIREELTPVERRLRKATGREQTPTTRVERWRAELKATEDEAADRARRAVRKARERV
ncbi:DUF7553 family protein [Halorussus pelagicus]|uniref:DUF7553 family protein n=1 Tax=Halorussus pelagicus TaxID=2505977 RepID=UPI000FFCC1E7|nr:hypothetical protein [Halorussus pelagicus]